MRQRKEFTKQEVEFITTLWNAGEPAENICRLAGITKNTLDYHRHCGALVHLPLRKKGVGPKRRRHDDEEKQMLFGLPKEEWEARRDAIRDQWTSEEAYERSKGIAPHSRKKPTGRNADEDLETTYNPGRDDSRAANIRHSTVPNRLQTEDQFSVA